MCECIKQVSKTALGHAEKQLNPTIDEKLLPLKESWCGGLENVEFTMGRKEGTLNPSGMKLKTDIVFQTDFQKKDGTRSKPKNNHMTLMFTYCPFCGLHYDEGTPASPNR